MATMATMATLMADLLKNLHLENLVGCSSPPPPHNLLLKKVNFSLGVAIVAMVAMT
jgi:hypothetical protein